MSLRVLRADELDAAAALLAGGAVVGVPTDTVYGLAARSDDDGAVAGLFAAKRRPSSVPIAVLCATAASVRALATAWPPAAARLAAACWPGPLTIVVPAHAPLAARLGAAGGVGLRVPDDATCQALLAVTGPLAVTSANLHGASPATSAAAVVAAFCDGVAAVLDDGAREGRVSTVVDVTGDGVTVLREGALEVAAVRAAISEG